MRCQLPGQCGKIEGTSSDTHLALNFSTLNNLGVGTAINFNGGTLHWVIGNSEDISARTVTIDARGAKFDVDVNSVWLFNEIGNAGPGALTKAGDGILTLDGIEQLHRRHPGQCRTLSMCNTTADSVPGT